MSKIDWRQKVQSLFFASFLLSFFAMFVFGYITLLVPGDDIWAEMISAACVQSVLSLAAWLIARWP